MSLNLDLGSSEAKVARAVQHFKVLKPEMTSHVKKTSAYRSEFTDVDPQTGWCEGYLVPTGKTEKPIFGVMLGDVVNNLRCALDYIVSELCKASNVTVTTQHQFPIFRSKQLYESTVGKIGAPNPKGPLGGIKHGDALIEALQPYKLQPEPRHDPLWIVHRFSNADKHRRVASAFVPPMPGPLDIKYNGNRVEFESGPPVPDWMPDQKILMARLRFDPPVATNLRTAGPITVRVGFKTDAFGNEVAQQIDLGVLGDACDHLTMVINQFKTL